MLDVYNVLDKKCYQKFIAFDLKHLEKIVSKVYFSPHMCYKEKLACEKFRKKK